MSVSVSEVATGPSVTYRYADSSNCATKKKIGTLKFECHNMGCYYNVHDTYTISLKTFNNTAIYSYTYDINQRSPLATSCLYVPSTITHDLYDDAIYVYGRLNYGPNYGNGTSGNIFTTPSIRINGKSVSISGIALRELYLGVGTADQLDIEVYISSTHGYCPSDWCSGDDLGPGGLV